MDISVIYGNKDCKRVWVWVRIQEPHSYPHPHPPSRYNKHTLKNGFFKNPLENLYRVNTFGGYSFDLASSLIIGKKFSFDLNEKWMCYIRMTSPIAYTISKVNFSPRRKQMKKKAMRTFIEASMRIKTKTKFRSSTSLRKLDRFTRSTYKQCSGTHEKCPHLKNFWDKNDFRGFLESVFDAESKKNIFKNFQEPKNSDFCIFRPKT